MRILTPLPSIFDTQVDTKKIFVPMKYDFVLRKYINKKGFSPIILHITIGHRERISLELETKASEWDKKSQRTTGKTEKDVGLNLILDNIDSKITAIKTYFFLAKKMLTMDKFLDEFNNGIPRIDFITFYDYLVKENPENLHPNTIKKQKSVLKNLRIFKSKILFADLDINMIMNYIKFSRTKGRKDTTINTDLACIKKYIGKALDSGIVIPIEMKQIKVGSTNGNREYLLADEVKKLYKYYFSEFLRENHEIPLGLFLVSCFTGIRISDALQMTSSKVVNGALKFTSIKTNKNQNVKLSTYAIKIMAKRPDLFDVPIAEQTINKKLKECASQVRINKVVTFHVGRHTFATNFIRQGGDVTVLQKILGHSDIQETMIYVKIVQEDQDREIMLLDNMDMESD